MKTESSLNQKESISLSKKSDCNSSAVKKKFNMTNLVTLNKFVKKLTTFKQSKLAGVHSKEMSLTDEMFKIRTKSITLKEDTVNNKETVNLNRELEDPDNLKIEKEIKKLVGVSCDITLLVDHYDNLIK